MVRSLGDVIEDLGFGGCQLRVGVLAGSIYAVGGELWFLLTVFPVGVAEELGLHAYQRAALGSVGAMGMMAGNLMCTLIADNFGRRKPLIFAFALSLFSASASAYVYSFEGIWWLWWLFGLAFGFGVPSYNALCSETSPAAWRYSVNSISMGQFAITTLIAVCIVDFYAPDLHGIENEWRNIMMVGRGAHALYLILAIYPGFVESAAVLAEKGKHDEAMAVLKDMREQNGRPDVDLNFDIQESMQNSVHDCREPLRILWLPRFRITVTVVCLTTIVLNLMTTGRGYALPYLLKDLDMGMSFAHSILFVEAFELLGYGSAPLVDRWLGRREILLMYLTGTMAATTMLLAGVHYVKSSGSQHYAGVGLFHMGLGLQRYFITLGWTAAYTVAAEAFPAAARATSSGLCIGIGRLGGISAPWLFEHLMLTTGSYVVFFVLLGAACAANAALLIGFLPETKGVTLDELEALVALGDNGK
eukprot:TRINITY_DN29370_c1_g2_i1.p1 TRINITY_DN29370_c1_g2~~TRINITY_DN29370_c1_g2_i1.p1  ORF type:complete len:474 (+),score=71.16 TRINITY_DN29370_c1_g2_i1:97-1518(+)